MVVILSDCWAKSKHNEKLILQGKSKKHLFYAFGETILIMVGVLLALQVNS